VGTGSVDVAASHRAHTWTATVTGRLACMLHVGATLPAAAKVSAVTLNGAPAPFVIRDSNRGRQVLVSASCSGTSRVEVITS
jgi:hypothetical protein